MHTSLRVIAPIIIFLVSVYAFYYLSTHSPHSERREVKASLPPVSAVSAQYQRISLPIYSRGLVEPTNEILLVSEVRGLVTKLSRNFVTGGTVRKGEQLVVIDTGQFELELTQAEAKLLAAKRALEFAELEYEEASSDIVPGLKPPIDYKKRQLKEAQLKVKAAQTHMKMLESQSKKRIIRAPYDGRVRAVNIGVGQSISPGTQIGYLYAVGQAEMRLPLSDTDLSVLGLPDSLLQGQDFNVNLKMQFAGKDYYWRGRAERLEGSLDIKNRLMYLVVHIVDPHSLDPDQPGRPTLTAGHFLEAEISGPDFEHVLVLPRKVLRYGNFVWTVSQGERIHKQPVDLIYKDRDYAYVRADIMSGVPIITTPISVAVEGMQVKINKVTEEPFYSESWLRHTNTTSKSGREIMTKRDASIGFVKNDLDRSSIGENRQRNAVQTNNRFRSDIESAKRVIDNIDSDKLENIATEMKNVASQISAMEESRASARDERNKNDRFDANPVSSSVRADANVLSLRAVPSPRGSKELH